MVNYPSQLTAEEKALRKRYTKLQEKTKELKEYREQQQQQAQSNSLLIIKSDNKTISTGGTQGNKEPAVNPKDAREAARKLLESGKLSIVNKRAQQKTTGFKRVGETSSSTNSPSTSSSNKGHPLLGGGSKRTGQQSSSTSQQSLPYKPKPVVRPAEVKQLYSRFVKSSDTIKEQKIPKFSSEQSSYHNDESMEVESSTTTQQQHGESTQDSTIYISWRDVGITDTTLRDALNRFGHIKTIKLRGQKEGFVTFLTPNIAKTVQREMNKGMIQGTEVRVEPAGKSNGYIELPPDVEDQPWAIISAGIDQLGVTEGGQSMVGSGRKRMATSRKPLPAYDQDF